MKPVEFHVDDYLKRQDVHEYTCITLIRQLSRNLREKENCSCSRFSRRWNPSYIWPISRFIYSQCRSIRSPVRNATTWAIIVQSVSSRKIQDLYWEMEAPTPHQHTKTKQFSSSSYFLWWFRNAQHAQFYLVVDMHFEKTPVLWQKYVMRHQRNEPGSTPRSKTWRFCLNWMFPS